MFDNSVKFLFIVPTLNSYEQLSPLIESFKKQDHKRWKVLFVDGPSTLCHKNFLEELALSDPRFSWIADESVPSSIYGAMNFGANLVTDEDYVLFWGSDDWLPHPSALRQLSSRIISARMPSLFIGGAKYMANPLARPVRISSFRVSGVVDRSRFRLCLFFGLVPPHQACAFNVRSGVLFHSNIRYRLAADLDLFLRISRQKGVSIRSDPSFFFSCLGNQGVSSSSSFLKFKEVFSAYSQSFGVFSTLPFLMRYVRRIFS